MVINEELVSRRWMVREEELDDDQYKIKMMKMDNYLVEGCAGSGKTILALQKAKEIQDLSLGSYLVVIYTLTLRSFIKDGVTSLELDPDRVCNFHALDKSGFDSADYIIVDEVQDFSAQDLNKLIKMAKKHFVFFGDDAQQLYASKTNNISLKDIINLSNISKENHKILEKNYRLPKPIAEFAQQISKNNDSLADRCTKIDGEKPLIINFINPKAQLDFIVNVVRNETLSDVGILVGTNEDIETIKRYFDSIGFRAEYKFYEEGKNKRVNDLDFYTDSPKVMTYHSSKGLQFEHVFLPMCQHGLTKYNFQEALYVAVTRPSQRLIIMYSQVLSPFIKNIDRKYYDYQKR
ncbi:3'-5' exonuclease [Bacillus sp. FJAT-27445]|uniref:3'-5' exonuclease n=1 Tax=Bacillus sp. FJAT-27445 TaxID=1679166 RepID=UPI0007438C37|nr:3'-5' exonuclease [Bacillus sp. FJAT-27445]